MTMTQISSEETGSENAISGSTPKSADTASEPSVVVYLKDVGGTAFDGQWDECWVPCAKGDPGATAFIPVAYGREEAVALVAAAKTTLGPFSVRSAKKPTAGHAINAIWQLGRAIELLRAPPASPADPNGPVPGKPSNQDLPQ